MYWRYRDDALYLALHRNGVAVAVATGPDSGEPVIDSASGSVSPAFRTLQDSLYRRTAFA
ncbi:MULTISPECIES: hypothetical protein [Desulfosediminicola]|uniref:hypothetical protein n=1 Tax=Desulfosediminicola TaxID=2886823 RepID=UPI0010ACEAE3|nr:hypothetical protein [Desulfosediminicola ganghwensis]